MGKISNLKKIQNSEAWRRRLEQCFRYLEQSKDIKQNRYLPFCDFDVIQKMFLERKLGPKLCFHPILIFS